MGSVLLGLQALDALLTLIGNASAAAQQIQSALQTAQSEGRDLTDAELAPVEAARKAAEAAAEALLKAP